MKQLILAILVALLPATAVAENASPTPDSTTSKVSLRHRTFFGGGIGLSFGDVDYIEVAPLVGLRVTPRIDAGLSLLYRWRSDGRYDPSIDTSDYGGTLFGRFRVMRSAFLEADWEYLNWEYIRSDLSTGRTNTSSFLAGGGYYQPLGGRTSFFFSALYNFSYDDNDPLEPYGSPWVFRAGIGMGF